MEMWAIFQIFGVKLGFAISIHHPSASPSPPAIRREAVHHGLHGAQIGGQRSAPDPSEVRECHTQQEGGAVAEHAEHAEHEAGRWVIGCDFGEEARRFFNLYYLVKMRSYEHCVGSGAIEFPNG